MSSILVAALLLGAGPSTTSSFDLEAHGMVGFDGEGSFRSFRGRAPLGSPRNVAELAQDIRPLLDGISSRGAAVSTLVPRWVSSDFPGRTIYEYDQYVGGILVEGQSVVVVVDRENNIRSIFGRMVTNQDLESSRAEQDERFTRAVQNLSSEQSIILSLDEGHLIKDEKTPGMYRTLDGIFVDWTLQGTVEKTGICNILRTDHQKFNGFTRNLSLPSGTTVSSSSCDSDEWFGVCYWHLKNPSPSNGLTRVDNMSGSESEKVQSCSSTNKPSFTSSITARLAEQNAFYYVDRARFFIHQNVWSSIPPPFWMNADVNVKSRYPLSAGVFGNYNTSTHDLRINSTAQFNVGTYLHEYGHHATWTYGLAVPSISTPCSPTAEMRGAHEMMADAFAMVVVADDPRINMAYSGNPNLQNLTPHTNEASILVDNSNGCTPTFILSSSGFLQAIWELLYGVDCTATNCVGLDPSSTFVWGVGVSQEEMIENVGMMLAFSLASTPDNARIIDITDAFRDAADNFSPAQKSRILSILDHHGR